MAKRYSPLAARGTLYGEKTSREKLVAEGRRAKAEQRYGAALLFFCEAKDPDGLAEMKRLAIDTGDCFILRAVDQAAADLVSDEDWKNAIARAKQLGKHSMAELGERHLRGETLRPEEPAPPEGSSPEGEGDKEGE